ncbi:MAG TPA: hypothetical protein VD907_03885 [Verrucomicrobiae bacterium]|nr:hypothetical protein [Verrucomicrobiae bacterium]
MNNAIYDDTAIERLAREQFGVALEMKHVIVRQAPVSHTAEATVFLTAKNQLFVLINAKSRLLLGDVRKIVIRMGLKAELFLPPRTEPDYFDRIGREKFREVFPGRTNITSADIAFYRTLAPYNPALVQILEVKEGIIRKFDPDSSNAWRTAAEFSYRRIPTS